MSLITSIQIETYKLSTIFGPCFFFILLLTFVPKLKLESW